ncbi:COQ9 family protein [Sedimentitalea nanhaiensis]|uniref:Ubiquinone biosynthesis protein COQ9 n=1 Tax=Sedimentitalea nanhaiensis TaxID=999627 RepID=A0A1I7CUK7_9RHOB|nr:COQ9 family protein [Sedimentitalea nanhaiensis]SFU03101.1 ubiquinone biosynthesis protein COQ9 [Sedimentitalea nanhaiensis]
MTLPESETRDRLLDAALMHVAFDGWSDATLKAAAADIGLDAALVRSVVPRGAVELALAYHARGDRAMLDRLRSEDLGYLKFREKIAAAVQFRLDAVEDKELVRRGATLFALPQYATDGAKAIWTTCDLIWESLGDTSEDVNWYSKRATLSGVYSATVLYWLGDTSADNAATWAFLDRRIDDVMQIEKLKANVRNNPVLKPLLAGPNWLLGHIRAPKKTGGEDLPGTVGPQR